MTTVVRTVLFGLPALTVPLFWVNAAPPRAVPTFHCISLYWDTTEGSSDVTCTMAYAVRGGPWKAGHPLWFDTTKSQYKGSIVHLDPDTTYDIELSLFGTGTSATTCTTTWSECFRWDTTKVVSTFSDLPLEIEQSGSDDGYVLYEPAPGDPAVIDVGGAHENCIRIKAGVKNVIIRGLTLRGATRHAIEIEEGVSDLVIEECDISDWGSTEGGVWGRNYDSAIYSQGNQVERIIIQNNRIHHPAYDSSNWSECRADCDTTLADFHPRGPQAVTLFDSAGNHVIRYNEVYSDDHHYFNDIFGAGDNFGEAGFPNRDSDIYGNYLSHCWDDAIESEGANENVRIWGNFIERTFVKIAVARTIKGPVYVFRNVAGSSATNGNLSTDDNGRGGFLKTKGMAGDGRIYVYHNTIWQPPPPPGATQLLGCLPGIGHGGTMKEVVSRNNILHVALDPTGRGASIADDQPDPESDYDYDLYNGAIVARAGSEPHGINELPIYARSSPWNHDEMTGDFSLLPTSPGYDAGDPIPNFNDAWTGAGPDIGAHEADTAVLCYGRRLGQQPLRISSVRLEGDRARIAWPAGIGVLLQSSPHLQGPWSDLPGTAGACEALLPRHPQREFFRLRQR